MNCNQLFASVSKKFKILLLKSILTKYSDYWKLNKISFNSGVYRIGLQYLINKYAELCN